MAATHLFRRSGCLLYRYITSASLSSSRSPLSQVHRLRPLVGGLSEAGSLSLSPSTAVWCCATLTKSFSGRVRDPVWKNSLPTVPPGCDFNHWFVLMMEPPHDQESRAEIIETYIKTLAFVVGSEEEARAKIYSISTCCYYSFGAHVSEEIAAKIQTLPKVIQVLPDCYLDVQNKDYGCEPFINGQALPNQQCKYHEKWQSHEFNKYLPNFGNEEFSAGCDYFHWFVYMKRPESKLSRPEIIDSYIKTLASVLGSVEEAKMKIYSVSTSCYYSFCALVPEEVALKLEELPQVRCVLPDLYIDDSKKIYGGEPFVNGEALPYNPKYHEQWRRNKAIENNSVRPVSKFCYKCGGSGHYARDCGRRYESSVGDERCYNCGNPGHYARDCPVPWF